MQSDDREVELKALIEEENRSSYIANMGYESLLSLMGIGKYHYGVILACALSNAADAVEIVAISFVISAAKDDLGMTDLEEGVLTAIIFLGMMFGGWIWGSMADQPRYGRKKILFYSLLINGIFGLLSVFTVDFYMLLILRFCSGLGVGGSIPVTFTYAAEFLPKEKRGFYLALLAVSWPFAATLTSLFAYAIIPNLEPFNIGSVEIQSWRIFLIPCSIPAFCASFVFYSKWVDYSPKWLIYTKHNFLKASKILVKVYKTNNDNKMDNFDQDLFEPNTLKSWVDKDMNVESQLLVDNHDSSNPENIVDDSELSLAKVNANNQYNAGDKDKPESVIINEQQYNILDANPSTNVSSLSLSGLNKVWFKTKMLFAKEYRRPHILAGIVWFTLSYAFYGLAEWLPTYFKGIESVNEYTSSIATSAAQFPGAILTCWFLEYCCDRKTTLSISVALGACSIIGIPYLNSGTDIVILLCVFNGVTVCAWSALDVVSTELSPTSIRSTAFGFFSAMGRIGAIVGNVTFGAFGQSDIASALTVCGIVLVIGTVSCMLLPSTKGVAIK